MKLLQQLASFGAIAAASLVISGCTTTVVLAHVHDKLTEGDPAPCVTLNTVQRALSPRCGAYTPGSLLTKDVVASGLATCPLALAARDPQFWPMLPELIARGAQPEACDPSPIVALAQADACPDFKGLASAESLRALRWLVEADSRAVHHDAVRLLSCPGARAVRLDQVLDQWLAQGALPARGLTFSPLSALHPDHLDSALTRNLLAQGHDLRDAFGAYDGRLTPGLEEALRGGHFAALDWWFGRLPELVNRVPSRSRNQLPWVPMVQVLTPRFMPDATRQTAMVEYLLARGADPWRVLPHDPSQTVVGHARRVSSPLLPLLDAQTRVGVPVLIPASDSGAMTASRAIGVRSLPP